MALHEKILKSEVLWAVMDLEHNTHGPKHEMLDYTIQLLNGYTKPYGGKKQFGATEYKIALKNLNELKKNYDLWHNERMIKYKKEMMKKKMDKIKDMF
jgi:hypothetical protein